MKQDLPLIKGSGGDIADWQNLAEQPTYVSLSGQIDTHLTEVKILSGDGVATGDLLMLNDNGTIGMAYKDPDTLTTPTVLVEPFTGIVEIDVKDENIIAVVWHVGGDASYVKIGELTGDTVEWGEDVHFHTPPLDAITYIHYDVISDRLIVWEKWSGYPYSGVARVGTMTTTGATSAHTVEFGESISLNGIHGGTNWTDSLFQYNEKENKSAG